MTRPYLIGITGGSASGKTLILTELMNFFSKNEICIISQDNYYRPREEQVFDKKGVQNFDSPDSIEQQAFADDVAKLRKGEVVTRQEYTFNNPKIIPKMLAFNPAPIIVVEGIFVFYLKEVSDQLDLKVFVSVEEHLMLKRRIVRDAQERGYDLEDVLYRFENHVIPTFNQYIKPFELSADIIIPNHKDFAKGLEVLKAFISLKLENSLT